MKRLAIFLVILSAGLGAAHSAQAAGWGETSTVSDPAEGSSDFSYVAVVPRDDGGFIYAWADTNQSARGVYTRVAGPDGNLGPIQRVFGGGFFARPFWLEAGGSGSDNRIAFMVQDKDCSACLYKYDLYTARLTEDGQFDDMPQVLDSTASFLEQLEQPDLSVAADGSALVAWERDSSGNHIKVAVGEAGEDMVVGTPFPSALDYEQPSVAAREGGGGFLGMTKQSGPAAYGAMLDSSGVPVDDVALLGAGDSGTEMQSAIDSTGKATAVFNQSVDSEWGIWARQMGPDGAPLGTATRVDTPGSSYNWSDGAVSVATDDTVAIGWSEYDYGDNWNEIKARPVSPAGSVGAIQTVALASSGNPPEITYGPSGPVALYSLDDTVDRPAQMATAPLNADLSPADEEVSLAEYEADDFFGGAALVYGPTGNGAALWDAQLGAQGWSSQADAAVYDATGPSLEPWIPPVMTVGFESIMGAESSDMNGPPGVSWDFGDGETDEGDYVSHTFESTGTFTITVTATDEVDNATTKTVQVQVVDPPPDHPVNPIPPDTNITGKPGKKVKAKSATFKFVSSLPGSKFECRLDKAGWSDCRSPKKYKKLKSGKHTFRVRAIKGDLIDQTPASYSWTVKKTKKK